MPMNVRHERDNVYRIEVRGLLRKPDFEVCGGTLVREMSRIGPVRLLFVLEDFKGWHPHDDWKDLTFYVTHGNQIEQIAIVGDQRWRSETLMFAGADLRTAPVEFFGENDLAGARAWLSA